MRLRQREESTFLQIWVWVKARDNYPSNCTIDYKLVGDWILSAGSQTKIFMDCTMYNNLSRDEDHVHTGRGRGGRRSDDFAPAGSHREVVTEASVSSGICHRHHRFPEGRP